MELAANSQPNPDPVCEGVVEDKSSVNVNISSNQRNADLRTRYSQNFSDFFLDPYTRC